MSKRKRKTYDDDDMRVIAPMNVEGMPWYAPKPKEPSDTDGGKPAELTRREARIYRNAALKAALLVAAVFGVCGFLFILFLLRIW